MIIFQDLDGCLVNFDKGFEQLSGGIPCKEYESKYGTKEFWKLITKQGKDFWVNLEWMPDGKILWNYIKKYNPILLTAPSSHPSSHEGKIEWRNRVLPSTDMIITHRKNKQLYSGPEKILIDDNIKTYEEWNSKGGIAILHKSALETINKLKELGL